MYYLGNILILHCTSSVHVYSRVPGAYSIWPYMCTVHVYSMLTIHVFQYWLHVYRDTSVRYRYRVRVRARVHSSVLEYRLLCTCVLQYVPVYRTRYTTPCVHVEYSSTQTSRTFLLKTKSFYWAEIINFLVPLEYWQQVHLSCHLRIAILYARVCCPKCRLSPFSTTRDQIRRDSAQRLQTKLRRDFQLSVDNRGIHWQTASVRRSLPFSLACCGYLWEYHG